MSRPDDLVAAQLSSHARRVLERRYLHEVRSGELESPEDLFWRVASTLAEVDAQYGATAVEVDLLARSFYSSMARGEFEPNSPTLMNAGRPRGQLATCFVLPIDDELSNGESGIYDTLTAMALVHQSGGGTGFSFSRIRPEGDRVRSTNGVASGPVSFMRLYDVSTDVVKQGGTRRGANMGILRVDHPDIRKFIDCKDDTSHITNFNISVAITDEFMRRARSDSQYDLVHPGTGDVVRRESARGVFDAIVDGAWRTGEPGVFFIDRANRDNPVPALGSYEATNPCGEQPLLPYDVCNLGSIDLGRFVRDAHEPSASIDDRIDWERLSQVVRVATHFLDNVVDESVYPLEKITSLARKIRRIGLGVMGWADMLVRLGIPYDSGEAVTLAGRVMRFVQQHAHDASEALAQSRGVFPEWGRSVWGPDATAARRPDGRRVRPERKLRNCNVTTVAPTGTISIIAGCSGGIEPLFAVAFVRNQAGMRVLDVNSDFVRTARAGGWYSDELMERIAAEGHIHFDEVPPDVQRVFRTAHDVAPEWHVRMQSAFQEHTDSAISKTTNFPRSATRDDVRRSFELAFDLGCKGVTVYRDGSRDGQVLSFGGVTGEGAQPSPAGAACLQCGASGVSFEQGCATCRACGDSECS